MSTVVQTDKRIAVKDTAIREDVGDHINDDNVCVAQVIAEKPTISSEFENLCNQFPSGPFTEDAHQDNRCFSKSYYFNRIWLCYYVIICAAYWQPCWLFASQRNNVWCKGIQDRKHLSERIKQQFLELSYGSYDVYELWKKSDKTIEKEL